MIDKYSDIINLPHHISKKHPQMSLYQRSAQFAPFAALTGYEGQIEETARLTENRIEIDDELKSVLDDKLQILLNSINLKPQITITYFIPDNKKDGGKYYTITDKIQKFDNYNELIILNNGTKIKILDIIEMEGDIFKKYETIHSY